MASVVTPERFASGMTYDQYVAFVGSAENLARESSGGAPPPRREFSAYFRQAYERCKLTDAQTRALRWLAAQPGGPAKLLVISEDWSSDCRRDVPTFARIAESAGLELRIFTRDGQKFSAANVPSLAEAPDSNADSWLSSCCTNQDLAVNPIAARRDLNRLSPPGIPGYYDKDRVVTTVAARPGTPQETAARGARELDELFNGPFSRSGPRTVDRSSRPTAAPAGWFSARIFTNCAVLVSSTAFSFE
jgi:hypothetical protein